MNGVTVNLNKMNKRRENPLYTLYMKKKIKVKNQKSSWFGFMY